MAVFSFELNAKRAETLSVIPYPQSVQILSGRFEASRAGFSMSSGWDGLSVKAVEEFAARLCLDTGRPSAEAQVNEDSSGRGFIFRKDDAHAAEAYSISISRKAVLVSASGFSGLFYAIQTLKQMLPETIYGTVPDAGAGWTLPCCRIEDAPRFAYRGTLLDVGRHFFSVEEVKEFIDVISMYKQNVLHWHLTEDQGWRIEIKKYPELTRIGSRRECTQVLGGAPDSSDGIPYGGFYTQDQVRDILEYASEHAVTVIPEIDMPGHLLSALASYPWLGCSGKSILDGSDYAVRTSWGVDKNVLCVGKESSFKFIFDVLDEVMELFPSKYINIGGDECPPDSWKQCPDCQARIKELGLTSNGETSAESYLQTWFTLRVEKYLNDHGRSIIGWDEILTDKLSKSATVMSWRGEKGGIKAAKAGHDVIMSPNTYLYINYRNSDDLENEPPGPHYLPIHTVYSYEPCSPSMTADESKRIIGVQENLWSEWIASGRHLEYMLLPRAASAAEVQWCQPGVKDYGRFLEDLAHQTRIYSVKGLTWSKEYLGLSGLPGKERPIVRTSDKKALNDIRVIKD